MTEILMGMFGALLMISAFFCGIVLGVKQGASKKVYSSKDEESEEEKELKRRKAVAEQIAFEAQMNYSPDVAYRMNGEGREYS